MRRTAALALAVLTFAACSGGTTSRDPEANVLSVPDGGGAKSNNDGKKESKRAEDGSKGRTDVATTDEARGEKKDGGSDGSRPPSGSGKRDSGAPGLPLPDAGSYSYVQGGWEELCQGANCDRSDLPPSQTVEISFERKNESRAVFVSETDGSGSRGQAITYDVRSGGASITKLKSTFSSGAFSFTSEIVPDPPVTAAVFPLVVGDEWSGRWEDRGGSVDGAYVFSVAGRDRMAIDGRARDVIVLDMDMKLTGDYRGTNEMRLWVLPEKFTIVATRGFTDIDSNYGTYRSRFTTSYRSGPGR
jgi:hypothetical protein